MRRRLRTLRLVASSAPLLMILGCLPGEEEELAGDSVADYRVMGALITNECGAGHAAPESLDFLVELREETGSTRAYWKLPEGPLITGAIDDDVYQFEATTHHPTIMRNAELGVVGCSLYRTETIEATVSDAEVDGGVAENGTFEGETRIVVGPDPGSDCSAVLVPLGGAFSALPCEIHYEWVGVATDELENP